MKKRLEDLIIDNHGLVIARITVEGNDEEGYSGSLYYEGVHEEIAALFSLYENYVNDQVFSLVDEVQSKILSYGLKLKKEKKEVKEIQLFGNDVYFKI